MKRNARCAGDAKELAVGRLSKLYWRIVNWRENGVRLNGFLGLRYLGDRRWGY